MAGAERDPVAEDMKRELHTRVEKRSWSTGHHYRLDLREDGLRGGRIVIKDPSHPDWPDRGRAARSKKEALRWVDEYVDRLGVDWCRGGKVLRTVRDHGEDFLEALEEQKGENSSTYRNRRSHLRNHIYPILADQRLRALAKEQVQELVDGLTTVKGTAAGESLKEGVYSALNKVWDHACSDPLPWRGKITIDRRDPNRLRRERAKAGVRKREQKSGYTVDDLRRILVAAMALDLVGRRDPKSNRAVYNHADLVAFLIHHILRIEEATFVRVKDILVWGCATCIPGTKTESAEERYMPTQLGYRPWAQRILNRDPDREDFWLPTSTSGGLPSVDTLKDKVRRVLLAADLKREGQLTHVFRASHISLARSGNVSQEKISAYAGHQIPDLKLIDDHYMIWEAFIDGLSPDDFDYMPHFGTPEEIEEEARKALKKGTLNL